MSVKVHFGLVIVSLTPSIAIAADNGLADQSGVYIGPSLDVGYDFGGQKLATVTFTDGSTQSIRSGEGAVIAAGFHIRPYRESPFDFRAMVGYKYEETGASNADVEFNRLTFELMPSVRLPYGVWAGAGVTYQSDIAFKTNGFTQNADVHIQNAVGPNVELGWRSSTHHFIDYGFALAYTALKYRDDYGDHFQGNCIGLRVTVNFGWTVFGDGRHYRSHLYSAVAPEEVTSVVPAPVEFPQTESIPSTTGSSFPRTLATGQVIILREARNLRWEPSAASYASVTLPAGTILTLESRVGGFWSVSTGTKSGWLSESEIQLQILVPSQANSTNPQAPATSVVNPFDTGFAPAPLSSEVPSSPELPQPDVSQPIPVYSAPVAEGTSDVDAQRTRARSEVKVVLDYQKPAIDRAVAAALNLGVGSGFVMVNFVVTPDGSIQHVVVSSSSFADHRVGASVAASLQQIKLQSKNVAPLTVEDYLIRVN